MLEYTYKFNCNRVKFALVLFLCVFIGCGRRCATKFTRGFLAVKDTSVFAIYVIFAVVVVVLDKNKFP
jgi:hypothetical protein